MSLLINPPTMSAITQYESYIVTLRSPIYDDVFWQQSVGHVSLSIVDILNHRQNHNERHLDVDRSQSIRDANRDVIFDVMILSTAAMSRDELQKKSYTFYKAI